MTVSGGRTDADKDVAAGGHPTPPGSHLRRWVAWCAAAEAVGMTAAATSAVIGQAVFGEPDTTGEAVTAIGLATAGGLIEGLAVGTATMAALVSITPSLPRRRWIGVTTAVAGLGWAAGSLPASLQAGGSADQSAFLFIVAGALAIGAAMGAVLGAAQAAVLRGHVRRPWRWIGASVLAWPPTMAIIFTGATAPDEGWPPLAVVALGTVTGLAAGAVLGALLGWRAPSLEPTEATPHDVPPRTAHGNTFATRSPA